MTKLEEKKRTTGGTSHGSCSKRRRAARPAAGLVVSLPDLLAGRRRHVLRRLRSLCRRRRAGVRDPEQILDRAAKPAIHFADLRRHDARRADHRICRRQVRTPLHLPDQPADLRAGVAGRGVLAGHDPAHRLPLRAGPGVRRRNRGRLFDADRIRAAEHARALAVDDGVPGGGRLSGDRSARLSHHPLLRMAPDVRASPPRARCRLVFAQEPAGIAALARIGGPHRGGRKP